MKKLIILIVALISASAWAEGEDLENCLYKNGVHIEFRVCELLKAEKAQDDLRIKRQADGAEELAALYKQREVDRIEYQAKKAQEQAIVEEKEKKRIAEMAHQEAVNKRNREQMARDEEKEEAVKKRKCGKDYMALRVGMTLERIDQCYEEPAYVTDTVSKGSVVETYRGTFYFIYVQNGRVIGYTRRTN